MIIGMATLSTVSQIGCQTPAGRTRLTDASGTKTSSKTTVSEPVPRNPIVSHVRSTLTPSAENGTEQWITWGPSGAPGQANVVEATLPVGAPLAGDLRALTRYP